MSAKVAHHSSRDIARASVGGSLETSFGWQANRRKEFTLSDDGKGPASFKKRAKASHVEREI
jgi:hypothetical protein